MFGVYAGTRPRTAEQTISVIREELDRAAAGLRPDEVARGKGTVRGSRLLALEDPFARMNRLGHAELVVGELPSIDEIQRRIEAVDEADIARVAARLIPTRHLHDRRRARCRRHGSRSSRRHGSRSSASR